MADLADPVPAMADPALAKVDPADLAPAMADSARYASSSYSSWVSELGFSSELSS